MKRRGTIHVGVSSLLLIFLVLALVSFAVLSLASASADLKLSRRYAERTKGYYDACMKAEDFLAETTRNGAPSDDALTADFPVTDTQFLHVELGPAEGNASSPVTVTAWQIVTDESALEQDESLPVLP